MEVHLLHAGTRVGRGEGAKWAAILAEALGRPVAPRPVRAGEPRGPGAWALLPRGAAPEGAVPLPRRDPRWSFEDLLQRGPEQLPPRARVVTGSALGEALLRRIRADLAPVRAGGFPVPEETPVLAEGPFEGLPSGRPLIPDVFVPAPGTGFTALVPPEGKEPPEAVRALADSEAAVAWEMELAFVEGLGDLPADAAVGAFARRKVSVLFALRAVLFLPGKNPRDLRVEIPQAGAAQFARAFGRHMAAGVGDTNGMQHSP